LFLIIEGAAEKVSKYIMLLVEENYGENEQKLILYSVEMLKNLTIFIIADFLFVFMFFYTFSELSSISSIVYNRSILSFQVQPNWI
jgi:hypothetical protein